MTLSEWERRLREKEDMKKHIELQLAGAINEPLTRTYEKQLAVVNQAIDSCIVSIETAKVKEKLAGRVKGDGHYSRCGRKEYAEGPAWAEESQ